MLIVSMYPLRGGVCGPAPDGLSGNQSSVLQGEGGRQGSPSDWMAQQGTHGRPICTCPPVATGHVVLGANLLLQDMLY